MGGVWRAMRRSRRGAAAVEYALVLFLIAMSVAGAIALTGGSVDTAIDRATDTIMGSRHVSVASGTLDAQGQVPLTVSLTRAPDAQEPPVTVRLQTVAGTAIAGTHFQPIDRVLSFAPDERAQTVLLQVDVTALPATPLALAALLSEPHNTELGTERAEIVLRGSDSEDPADATVSFGDAAAIVLVEGSAPRQVVLQLSAAQSAPTEVALQWQAPESGAAAVAADFAALPATVTVPAGASTATLDIAAVEDAVTEAPESARLVILSASNAAATVAPTAPSVLEIAVQDAGGPPAATVAFASATPLALTEGGAAQAVTVTLSQALPQDTSVAVEWAAPAEGSAADSADFATLPAAVVIPANATSAMLSVEALTDDAQEVLETAVLHIASASAPGLDIAVGEPQHLPVTVAANGDAPVVYLAALPAAAVAEGNTASFSVRLSHSAAGPVSVTVDAAHDTTDSNDWTASGGSLPRVLTFAAGETERTVSLAILSDAVAEPEESLTVALSAPSGAQLSTDPAQPSTATLRITASSAAPPRIGFLTRPAATVAEGESTSFTIGLDRVSSQDASVWLYLDWNTSREENWSFAPGAPLQVVVPAGTLSVSFDIAAVDDAVREGEESLSLSLYTTVGATLDYSMNYASISIDANDEDEMPEAYVSAYDTYFSEDSGEYGGQFLISLSAPLEEDVTIAFTWGGTATLGVDYAPWESSPITIPAGDTEYYVGPNVIEDDILETDETVSLTLTPMNGPVLIAPGRTATVDIRDAEYGYDDDTGDSLQYVFDYSVGPWEGSQSCGEAGTMTRSVQCVRRTYINDSELQDTRVEPDSMCDSRGYSRPADSYSGDRGNCDLDFEVSHGAWLSTCSSSTHRAFTVRCVGSGTEASLDLCALNPQAGESSRDIPEPEYEPNYASCSYGWGAVTGYDTCDEATLVRPTTHRCEYRSPEGYAVAVAADAECTSHGVPKPVDNRAVIGVCHWDCRTGAAWGTCTGSMMGETVQSWVDPGGETTDTGRQGASIDAYCGSFRAQCCEILVADPPTGYQEVRIRAYSGPNSNSWALDCGWTQGEQQHVPY